MWSRGEEEIPDCDDMAHISGPDGQFSLRISDVFLQDSGLYTCTVYNKHGMAQSHTRLVVVGKFTILEFLGLFAFLCFCFSREWSKIQEVCNGYHVSCT